MLPWQVAGHVDAPVEQQRDLPRPVRCSGRDNFSERVTTAENRLGIKRSSGRPWASGYGGTPQTRVFAMSTVITHERNVAQFPLTKGQSSHCACVPVAVAMYE